MVCRYLKHQVLRMILSELYFPYFQSIWFSIYSLSLLCLFIDLSVSKFKSIRDLEGDFHM